MNDFIIPWEKYAVIAELAKRMNPRPFGKTSLQKLVFLLQEHLKVDLGYQFNLYTYGPFTPDLLQDLDFVESLGGVNVLSYQNDMLYGYNIIQGGNSDEIIELGNISDIKPKIELLIQDFGNFQAKDLELRATIVYVWKEMEQVGLDKNGLLELVKGVKPKFPEKMIRDAIKELKEKKYIQI